MAESIRAILTDLEGVAVPASFVTGTLVPYSQERIRAYIADHWEDEEVEEALGEAGRLFGGFTLELEQADALLQRWIKQDRKATPLKFLQGLIWQEGYENGTFKPELYADVAENLKSWSSSGLRLFVYSSSSELAQKMMLSHSSAGDLTPLFEGFLDTNVGQKIEPTSYRTICEQLALPAEAILMLSDNEEELDAAKEVGLATIRIARDGAAGGRHPVASDFAAVKIV